ncbi:cyclic pyranopterin monophosphate synthase MoaC [Peptoniphilus mikwangii]|uniref:cyclic pyranopterin monophosphate synthase MoaC n=1 Tax=Peptoniphilus mikwangii TaxID=1354300 RepID=UPI0004164D87|nr:cyclic pyranopterin monophosphate synthase MoaC [Peptoniphilus mikwangii]
MKKFTHFNEDGMPKMVDVSEKDKTVRIAAASGQVLLNAETFKRIKDKTIEKGDVLAVAQVAGIMAAKKTSDIIPMCHNINLSGVDIKFILDEDKNIIEVQSTVKTTSETGVEMEALHTVSVAMLTIYDMCKAVQKDIILTNIYLMGKVGGKSGEYGSIVI